MPGERPPLAECNSRHGDWAAGCPLEVSREKGSLVPAGWSPPRVGFEGASRGNVSVKEWLLGSEWHLKSQAGLA